MSCNHVLRADGKVLAYETTTHAPEVREVSFLSEYRGEQIPAGKKSVAVAVSFQSPERTLSSADAVALRERVVDELASLTGMPAAAMTSLSASAPCFALNQFQV